MGKAPQTRRRRVHHQQRTPGKMNKTETKFAEVLEHRRRLGELVSWQFEPLTFKLAKGSTYTPDFLIEFATGGLEAVDVKGGGGWEDNARTKIKNAARRFPWLTWAGEKLERGHGWRREEFGEVLTEPGIPAEALYDCLREIVNRTGFKPTAGDLAQWPFLADFAQK